MMSALRAAALSLVLGVAVAVPSAMGATATTPAADPAAKQIEAFHAVLLDTMKRAKEVGVQGRYKKLEPAVDAAFDFGTMTQLIAGPSWSAMSPADRKSVTDAFRRMTIANYAKNFDGYSGEQFVTSPQVQERNGDKIVSTQMTAPGKAPISFVYRLDNKQGSWKIADIFLNGYVSEVATRRADFASTLTSGGAPALVQKLNSLSDNMLR
jgi:phospholipid transport system substrate-binding protein